MDTAKLAALLMRLPPPGASQNQQTDQGPSEVPFAVQRMRDFSGAFQPFNPALNAQMIEQQRSNGNRADLSRPVIPGNAPSYGIRPPIMDEFLPAFGRYQPNSIE